MILNSIKFFLRIYPYTNRLQTLYVDKKSRIIYTNVDNPIYEGNDIAKLLGFGKNALKVDIESMRKIEMNNKAENCIH